LGLGNWELVVFPEIGLSYEPLRTNHLPDCLEVLQ
jgi:hypothetical protein